MIKSMSFEAKSASVLENGFVDGARGNERVLGELEKEVRFETDREFDQAGYHAWLERCRESAEQMRTDDPKTAAQIFSLAGRVAKRYGDLNIACRSYLESAKLFGPDDTLGTALWLASQCLPKLSPSDTGYTGEWAELAQEIKDAETQGGHDVPASVTVEPPASSEMPEGATLDVSKEEEQSILASQQPAQSEEQATISDGRVADPVTAEKPSNLETRAGVIPSELAEAFDDKTVLGKLEGYLEQQTASQMPEALGFVGAMDRFMSELKNFHVEEGLDAGEGIEKNTPAIVALDTLGRSFYKLLYADSVLDKVESAIYLRDALNKVLDSATKGRVQVRACFEQDSFDMNFMVTDSKSDSRLYVKQPVSFLIYEPDQHGTIKKRIVYASVITV